MRLSHFVSSHLVVMAAPGGCSRCRPGGPDQEVTDALVGGVVVAAPGAPAVLDRGVRGFAVGVGCGDVAP